MPIQINMWGTWEPFPKGMGPQIKVDPWNLQSVQSQELSTYFLGVLHIPNFWGSCGPKHLIYLTCACHLYLSGFEGYVLLAGQYCLGYVPNISFWDKCILICLVLFKSEYPQSIGFSRGRYGITMSIQPQGRWTPSLRYNSLQSSTLHWDHGCWGPHLERTWCPWKRQLLTKVFVWVCMASCQLRAKEADVVSSQAKAPLCVSPECAVERMEGQSEPFPNNGRRIVLGKVEIYFCSVSWTDSNHTHVLKVPARSGHAFGRPP